jgi:hypothetical protein
LLLVLPGAPQPARRFLRALINMSPADGHRFVVATGDYIDFNTIYRDRRIAWPILDLPVTLVAFCHRNPVDPAAFVPDAGSENGSTNNDMAAPGKRTSTGTHDLLLYQDIAATLVHGVYFGKRLLTDADALRAALAQDERFDEAGNLKSGTEEYVICLRPVREHDRVVPRARLQVWRRRTDVSGKHHWDRVSIGGEPELAVSYANNADAKRR